MRTRDKLRLARKAYELALEPYQREYFLRLHGIQRAEFFPAFLAYADAMRNLGNTQTLAELYESGCGSYDYLSYKYGAMLMGLKLESQLAI